MTTLNADIIECLRLGLICAERDAKRLDYGDQSPPFFRMSGDHETDSAIAATTIGMMKTVLSLVSQTIDPNRMMPSDHAIEAGEWLRNRIIRLNGSCDVGATSERQRLEQIFELLATAHPIMIGEDRKALLAQLETFVDQPASFSPAAVEALVKRTIKHLNGSPV